MPIRVIIDFQAQPGGRAALLAALSDLIARHGASAEGYRGSTRYEVPGEPDRLVEIAEWDSVEAHAAHGQAAAASGIYAPVFALVAGPPKITRINELA